MKLHYGVFLWNKTKLIKKNILTEAGEDDFITNTS